jgi:osmoprotectant transport system ATP-binding protein
MIELRDVDKAYGTGAHALRGVTLSTPTGAFTVLIGPSGSGKSTALSLVNRLIEPTRGTVSIDGSDIRQSDPVALRRRIGFVFQGIGLFPHLTVGENIGITPRLLGWPPPDIAARVAELLELVRLPSRYADRLPQQLSGGEQQRVGIARALAARPSSMLMDEPFAALDPLTRDELGQEYRAIHDRLALTTIMVTHDMTEALLLADRIAVMRDGAIVQTGAPQELVAAPADDFVRSLLDSPRRRAQRLADALKAAPA